MWPFRSARAPSLPSPSGEVAEHPRKRHAGWNFEEGSPIAPGRSTLKRLGGGSAYEVYLVWDEGLFALAVAKLLRPDRVTEAHALKDLRREADLLKRLAHPALVRGFDAVLDGPHPQLLLEYAEGPTLHQVIGKHGALPPEQLAPLALHVASVLQYLSSQRVVHLDVKPGNIVMGLPPRLIDLSIARAFEDAARLRVGAGTDAYMAPEQCDPSSSSAPVGPASDVWGFGATLYHACSGRRPFERDRLFDESDPTSRFPQLVREPPPLPRQVPAPLAEIIARMLRKRPAERPSLPEVVASLEPLLPRDRPKRLAAR